MALKSSREGLRRELVDYLGNIIIDRKLRNDIINSVNDVFAKQSDVLTLEEIQASTDLTGKIASASALYAISDKVVRINEQNPKDLNECNDLHTAYIWDYGGSNYVTVGGEPFGTSAGSVINFPNLGGITQVFTHYTDPIIKIRVLYQSSWSSWYKITVALS